jgi:hypothetical protein
VALIFKGHPIMHKSFTRHCLSDAIKNLGVEVKAYARTARDNAYIVARLSIHQFSASRVEAVARR